MPTWIARFDTPVGPAIVPGAAGPERALDAPIRVAVKDAIDVAGFATTAGCAAVAETAAPALADAACLAGFRAAGAILVGKANLDELCLGATGINASFGTPVNPLAPDRIPGGSSSGSAVAVASGEADIGLGTDTGGSIRIPAACCGLVGLKTTWGRISTNGVWPLSPSLDTVGPLATDISGVVRAMQMLEPGFAVAQRSARLVGRLRLEGVNPLVEEAIDAALSTAGLEVHDVHLDGWASTFASFGDILVAEFWQAHRRLLDAHGLGDIAKEALQHGMAITPQMRASADSKQRAWQAELAEVLGRVEILALPTLVSLPPKLDETAGFPYTSLTSPFNVAGVPALSMPVPRPDQPVPASLQLVGPRGGEELLCATGLAIEASLP